MDRTHLRLPGAGEDHGNRVAGLAPLTGIAAGVGIGALLGVLRAAGWRPGTAIGCVTATVGALLGTNGPMMALGITDPRTWSAKDWAADVVPHLAYGGLTIGVLHGLDR
ncbi:hypothetical protein [Streptantibioticus ferralitis]|uniref:hypothetical protein n=1 Tax=Streptantibioticus ferralitis TaxID=236510 RepID=UPI0027E21A55|nr:hypothetical protein [Streptantibioticus ferralitis]